MSKTDSNREPVDRTVQALALQAAIEWLERRGYVVQYADRTSATLVRPRRRSWIGRIADRLARRSAVVEVRVDLSGRVFIVD